MTDLSINGIVRSFAQKKNWEKQFPINYYIVRPLSFLVTYFIIRLTKSPSKVAYFGFVLGLIGCFSFLGLYRWSAWPGIILLTVFSLLDAVDGNIARTTGNITYYGKYLDSVLGEIIESSYFLLLGFGLSISDWLLFRNKFPVDTIDYNLVLPLICGSIISTGRLLSSFIDLKYEYHTFEKQSRRTITVIDGEIRTSTFRNKWYYLAFINLNLLNNQLVLLIFCHLFIHISLALYILTPYYIVRPIVFFVFFNNRAKKKLA